MHAPLSRRPELLPGLQVLLYACTAEQVDKVRELLPGLQVFSLPVRRLSL